MDQLPAVKGQLPGMLHLSLTMLIETSIMNNVNNRHFKMNSEITLLITLRRFILILSLALFFSLSLSLFLFCSCVYFLSLIHI